MKPVLGPSVRVVIPLHQQDGGWRQGEKHRRHLIPTRPSVPRLHRARDLTSRWQRTLGANSLAKPCLQFHSDTYRLLF